MPSAASRHLLAIGAAIGTAVALIYPSYGHISSAVQLACTAESVACLGALIVLERRIPHLDRRFVLALILVLLLVAVMAPPRRSRDLWQYAMYGRMVAVHHASPYEKVPYDFRTDPAYKRIDAIWRHTPSLYGPGFTVLSGEIERVVGLSERNTRLAYQGLAALAVAASVLLVDRRTRDPMALLVMAANPVVISWTVNGGHNDALVGVFLLGAALLTERKRVAWAGLLVGLAVLVKVIAILVVVPLGWWLWRHRDKDRSTADSLRLPVILGAMTGLVTAIGFAVGGGRPAIDKLRNASTGTSWASVWRFIGDNILNGKGHELPHLVSLFALALVGLTLLATTLVRGDDKTPFLAVAAGLSAYLLGAPYTLIWYLAWVLPLLALHWRSRLASLMFGFTALELLAADQARKVNPNDPIPTVLNITTHVLHAFEVVALSGLLVSAVLILNRRRLTLAKDPVHANG